MMPLSSPPRAATYSAGEPFPPQQHVYQAVPDFSPLYPDVQPPLLASYRPRRRVTVVRRPAGCNLVRPCALASQITRMLLFNGCSAVLSVVGALLVWAGVALAVVTLPLLGFGIVVFKCLQHVVFYLCCTDVFVYNALAASAADYIDMDMDQWTSSTELHPLLPIRVPPPLGAGSGQVLEPCPRFERSLGTARTWTQLEPRSVLATVYFGCFKVLVGAAQMLAVALVAGVLGFLIGDKRVPVHLEALTAQYPFAVYTTAFGLLMVALAMLHGVTRASKVVTRFFCCETSWVMPSTAASKARRQSKTSSCCAKKRNLVTLSRCQHRVCFKCLSRTCTEALKNETPATCWKCSKEIALDQVEIVLSRSEFVMYMTRRHKEDTARADCASCTAKKDVCQLRVAPCGHHYCQPCLLRMCRLALGDRALIPLRCCKKELPDDYVRESLHGAADYAKYQQLMTEKDWKVSDLASDAEYTATVKAMGAKQCPGCGIGVQRDFGCVHMTCPNGHQFCYTCLQFWGTCHCPLIPEAELRAILGE
ncbi:Inorganic pyrophosphatase 3 [Phytophthora cinnamomi]|uniref:Inorganic pyrophosphatase 3 n=1 Tax=Phytophthora cinnamomi TaxID=4785 RepID=UPI00355A085C|nr:Inorganic pyrophosphatase 3 [Phytophthora cinnamomi]